MGSGFWGPQKATSEGVVSDNNGGFNWVVIVKPSQLWVSVAYLCQTTKDWIPSSHLRFRIMIRVIRVNSNIADHERVRGRPQHLKLTIDSSITQWLGFFYPVSVISDALYRILWRERGVITVYLK